MSGSRKMVSENIFFVYRKSEVINESTRKPEKSLFFCRYTFDLFPLYKVEWTMNDYASPIKYE